MHLAARTTRNESVQLHLQQHGGNDIRRQSTALNQRVHADRIMTDLFQERGHRWIELWLRCSVFMRRLYRDAGQRTQLFENILRGFHELGALTNKCMTATRLRGVPAKDIERRVGRQPSFHYGPR